MGRRKQRTERRTDKAAHHSEERKGKYQTAKGRTRNGSEIRKAAEQRSAKRSGPLISGLVTLCSFLRRSRQVKSRVHRRSIMRRINGDPLLGGARQSAIVLKSSSSGQRRWYGVKPWRGRN